MRSESILWDNKEIKSNKKEVMEDCNIFSTGDGSRFSSRFDTEEWVCPKGIAFHLGFKNIV